MHTPLNRIVKEPLRRPIAGPSEPTPTLWRSRRAEERLRAPLLRRATGRVPMTARCPSQCQARTQSLDSAACSAGSLGQSPHWGGGGAIGPIGPIGLIGPKEPACRIDPIRPIRPIGPILPQSKPPSSGMPSAHLRLPWRLAQAARHLPGRCQRTRRIGARREARCCPARNRQKRHRESFLLFRTPPGRSEREPFGCLQACAGRVTEPGRGEPCVRPSRGFQTPREANEGRPRPELPSRGVCNPREAVRPYCAMQSSERARTSPWRARPRRGWGYFTSVNLALGAPQTGHLSGALPSTVLPQTPQTKIAAAGRSLPAFTAARALP